MLRNRHLILEDREIGAVKLNTVSHARRHVRDAVVSLLELKMDTAKARSVILEEVDRAMSDFDDIQRSDGGGD